MSSASVGQSSSCVISTWGSRRYADLLQSLNGIPTNLRSDRLKRLEDCGVVERMFYSDHPPRAKYRLTRKGKAFIPVLVALKEYGEKWEPLKRGTARPGAAVIVYRFNDLGYSRGLMPAGQTPYKSGRQMPRGQDRRIRPRRAPSDPSRRFGDDHRMWAKRPTAF